MSRHLPYMSPEVLRRIGDEQAALYAHAVWALRDPEIGEEWGGVEGQVRWVVLGCMGWCGVGRAGGGWMGWGQAGCVEQGPP